MEDETMFLCGYKRTPRYGTTTAGSSSSLKPTYNKIIKHKVIPSDTLQGISLKYGSQITEIKRMNKLWSNDSIHLREILNIPVLITNEDGSLHVTATGSGHVQKVSTGSTITSDSCYSSMSEGDQQNDSSLSTAPCCSGSISSSNNPHHNHHVASPRRVQLEENGEHSSDYDKSDLTVNDFLQRIDSNIKLTSRNVQRLEKQSTIEKLFSNGESSFLTPSSSRASFQDVSLTPSPSADFRTISGFAPVRSRTNSKTSSNANGKKSAARQSVELQEIHDRFYQL